MQRRNQLFYLLVLIALWVWQPHFRAAGCETGDAGNDGGEDDAESELPQGEALASLTQSYFKKIAKVTAPDRTLLIRELERMEKSLTAARKFEDALFVREQRTRVQGKKSAFPIDLDKIPDHLDQFRQRAENYNRHLRARISPWELKYIEELRKLERRLGAENNLKEAIEVQKKLASVKERRKEEALMIKLKGKKPSGDVALADRGARAIAQDKAEMMIDGQTKIERYAVGQWPCDFEITLAELYMLDQINVYFWNGDERKYYYILEVSENGKKWQTIDDRSKTGGSGKEVHRFEMRDVLAIRIRGIKNSANHRFHVVEVEAH